MGERLTQRSRRSQRNSIVLVLVVVLVLESFEPGSRLPVPGRCKQRPSRPHSQIRKFSSPKIEDEDDDEHEDERRNWHSREAPLALLYLKNPTRNSKSKTQNATLKAPIPVAPPRPSSAAAIDPPVFRFFPAHSPARSPLELTLEPPPRVHGEHFANAFLSLLSRATEIANSAVPPDLQLTGAKSLVSNWLA